MLPSILLCRRWFEFFYHTPTLGALSDHDLQAFSDSVMQDFALALLIGTDQDSSWCDGKLVIDANHHNIHLLQAAFYAVRVECQRRGLVVVGC